MIAEILDIIAKFKQRPGAIFVEPLTATTVRCTYPHEQFFIQFVIDGEIKKSAFVELSSLEDGAFKVYEKNSPEIKLYKGREYKWQKPLDGLQDPSKCEYFEDLICTEEFLTALTIAPNFNNTKNILSDGISVRPNKAVVTNSITLVSMDTQVEPKEPFTIPSHFFKFLNATVPISINVMKITPVKYVIVNGLDWQLVFIGVDGYPEVETILPCKWDTEIGAGSLREFIFENLKNVDGESYICNMRFHANDYKYDIQLVSLDVDEKPIDIVEGSLPIVRKLSTTTSDCYLQVDLEQLEELCKFVVPVDNFRFNWSSKVLTPVSLGDSSTSSFAVIMPIRPDKDLQWIER